MTGPFTTGATGPNRRRSLLSRLLRPGPLRGGRHRDVQGMPHGRRCLASETGSSPTSRSSSALPAPARMRARSASPVWQAASPVPFRWRPASWSRSRRMTISSNMRSKSSETRSSRRATRARSHVPCPRRAGRRRRHGGAHLDVEPRGGARHPRPLGTRGRSGRCPLLASGGRRLLLLVLARRRPPTTPVVLHEWGDCGRSFGRHRSDRRIRARRRDRVVFRPGGLADSVSTARRRGRRCVRHVCGGASDRNPLQLTRTLGAGARSKGGATRRARRGDG